MIKRYGLDPEHSDNLTQAWEHYFLQSTLSKHTSNVVQCLDYEGQESAAYIKTEYLSETLLSKLPKVLSADDTSKLEVIN